MGFMSDMGNRLKYYLSSTVLLLWSFVMCWAVPQKPAQERLVNDYAHMFSYQQTYQLEEALTQFWKETSNQIVVVTTNDLEGLEPWEYATQLGQSWGVGGEKYDNGVVVLIKPKTEDSKGRAFIAPGYGLEGAIPDITATQIVENQMIPHFRENDYFGGVVAACQVIMGLASGEISEVPSGSGDDGGAMVIGMLIALMIFYFIFALVRNHKNGNDGNSGNPGNRIDDVDIMDTIFTASMLGRGRHSGGGFGGGGFSGGGDFGSDSDSGGGGDFGGDSD